MSDYPMLISNKLHSFRNFFSQIYKITFIKANFSNKIAFANVNGVGYVHFVKSPHFTAGKLQQDSSSFETYLITEWNFRQQAGDGDYKPATLYELIFKYCPLQQSEYDSVVRSCFILRMPLS